MAWSPVEHLLTKFEAFFGVSDEVGVAFGEVEMAAGAEVNVCRYMLIFTTGGVQLAYRDQAGPAAHGRWLRLQHGCLHPSALQLRTNEPGAS